MESLGFRKRDDLYEIKKGSEAIDGEVVVEQIKNLGSIMSLFVPLQ